MVALFKISFRSLFFWRQKNKTHQWSYLNSLRSFVTALLKRNIWRALRECNKLMINQQSHDFLCYSRAITMMQLLVDVNYVNKAIWKSESSKVIKDAFLWEIFYVVTLKTFLISNSSKKNTWFYTFWPHFQFPLSFLVFM